MAVMLEASFPADLQGLGQLPQPPIYPLSEAADNNIIKFGGMLFHTMLPAVAWIATLTPV